MRNTSRSVYLSLSGQHKFDRISGMDCRGIKDCDRALRHGHQQPNLRAAKDHPFRALFGLFFNHLNIEIARRFAEGPEAKLIKYDLIDARPIGVVWDQALNTKLRAQAPR